MGKKYSDKSSKWKAIHYLVVARKFTNGTLSSLLATTIIQPIDTIKVQIQVNSEQLSLGNKSASINPKDVFKQITKENGLGGLYAGIGSAWLR